MPAQKQRLYVGTYTDRKTPSEGIYLCEFDPATASLEITGATKSLNPSFLALSADRRFLYAVNEDTQFEGVPGGGVSAYAVNAASGALTLLNSQPTHGDHPCHILIDASGGWAFVSNYTSGSLTVLPIQPDGRLGAPRVIQHHGSGLHPERQASAHVHSTVFDPLGRLLVADLGMDQVVIYQFDPASGKLSPDGAIPMTPGMGPRHMAFTPDGRCFYVIGELDGTVAAFSFDRASGKYQPIQTIPTLPPEHSFKECADLHVAPSGKFLYGSNRGNHDSIVGYAIDSISGQLALVGYFPTGGSAPRNFGFDLTGDFVLAANQQSDSITVFRADASGRLLATGQSLTIPVPVCVQAFV